jgi:hypothetical protein
MEQPRVALRFGSGVHTTGQAREIGEGNVFDINIRRPFRSTRLPGLAIRFAARSVCRLALAPYRLVLRFSDRIDERRARDRRRVFGRRLVILSWHRGSDGLWKARLSGPGLVCTIERSAPTRCRAISRSARAMARILTLRRGLEGPPVRDPKTKPGRTN